MNKVNRIFVVVAVICLLEYIFVRGMFTWLLSVSAVCVAGAVNIFFSFKQKNWDILALTVLFCVALISGYLMIA